MAIDRDKRTDNRGATLTPGARVLSGDRQKLGAVKDVDGTYFKVDAPAQRDYWLSSDDIESIDADEVVLAFDKSTLLIRACGCGLRSTRA